MKIVMVDERGKYYETDGPVSGSIFPTVKAKIAVQIVQNDRVVAYFKENKLSNYIYLDDSDGNDTIYIERGSSDLFVEGKKDLDSLKVVVKNNTLYDGDITIRGIKSREGITVQNNCLVNPYNQLILDNCTVTNAEGAAYNLDYTGKVFIVNNVYGYDTSKYLVKGKGQGMTSVIVDKTGRLLRIPSTNGVAYVPNVVSREYVTDCNLYYEGKNPAGYFKIEK